MLSLKKLLMGNTLFVMIVELYRQLRLGDLPYFFSLSKTRCFDLDSFWRSLGDEADDKPNSSSISEEDEEEEQEEDEEDDEEDGDKENSSRDSA